MVKKYNCILIVLVFIGSTLFCSDIKKNKLELVKTIIAGNGEGELGFNSYDPYAQPHGVGIDINYHLFISDYANERLLEFDNNLFYLKYYNQ